ncbi:MAG: LysR family transcriptional regulator [Pseudomonadota bacterium]
MKRYAIPSSSALTAFESVARLNGVGRAAAALNTSQSAVSRHLKQLEETLGTPLFAKAGRGIALTEAGKGYFAAVAPALDAIHKAGRTLRLPDKHVIIACTHEVSHMIVMPRFAELRTALGQAVQVRILTCEYDLVPEMVDAGADITFEFSQGPFNAALVPVLAEAIIPVAAPGFAQTQRRVLGGSVSRWGDLPFLALTKNNVGWATWADWFSARSAGPPPVPTERFDNYVYLLEAAASGAGLALGWRGFVDRYLDAGTLVTVGDEWLVRSNQLSARLTGKGLANAAARKCLAFLAGPNAIQVQRQKCV